MAKSKLGNPAAVAAASSSPDLVKGATKIVMQSQESIFSGIKTTAIIVGGGFTLWYANKKYKEWRKQQFVNKNAHIPDVQAAMIMRKAMFSIELNSFPFNLISIPDGTNETLLNQLAQQVTSLESVIKAYRILFESNLILDVYSELNDKELQRFYENLGSRGGYESQFNANGSVKPQKPFKIGQTIEVKNPEGTTIYKTEETNGKYKQLSASRDFMKFSQEIGDIVAVYKGVSGQYYYVVDVYLSPDWIYGHGWVAHTEVKVKV